MFNSTCAKTPLSFHLLFHILSQDGATLKCSWTTHLHPSTFISHLVKTNGVSLTAFNSLSFNLPPLDQLLLHLYKFHLLSCILLGSLAATCPCVPSVPSHQKPKAFTMFYDHDWRLCGNGESLGPVCCSFSEWNCRKRFPTRYLRYLTNINQSPGGGGGGGCYLWNGFVIAPSILRRSVVQVVFLVSGRRI